MRSHGAWTGMEAWGMDMEMMEEAASATGDGQRQDRLMGILKLFWLSFNRAGPGV